AGRITQSRKSWLSYSAVLWQQLLLIAEPTGHEYTLPGGLVHIKNDVINRLKGTGISEDNVQ
ncbi:hypothetical protein, partial [Escherichia coli]|uniref:hypothetical protein n=1 Tax=Escherichia coli TaxID=562 RepID=UPI001BDCB9E5